MKNPATKELKNLVQLLKRDYPRHINLLNFVEDYPVTSYERAGKSLLLRGVSDRAWVFLSSDSPAELDGLIKRMNPDDRNFAAIEEWMIPVITSGRAILWDLDMIQFYIPAGVSVHRPSKPIAALRSADAGYVYENSDYREYLTVEYIKDRIAKGPSAAIYDGGKLAAWALTQDDGAMGALHVLECCRGKGFGREITAALIQRIRRRGRLPFAYIRRDNTAALNLVRKFGFVEQKRVHWLELK